MTQKNPSTPYISSNLQAFNQTYKELNDIYHDVAQNSGLSNSSFDIFYAICELGDGCLQRDICRTTFFPKQTVNSSIRNLEKNGYLTLEKGRGRNMHIYLTDEGKAFVQRIMFPVFQIENEAFARLSKEECEQLLHLQKKYNAALRAGFEAYTASLCKPKEHL